MNINNWQLWLGLGVSIFSLLLLAYNVNLTEIATSLAEANYLYAVPAVGIYFLAVYFRAIRWRFLLSPLASLPVNRLYPVVIIGYMANNLMPARLGELVRSYYLARREKVSGSSALATIAIERVYDGVPLLAFAAISAPVLLLLGKFDATGETYRCPIPDRLSRADICHLPRVLAVVGFGFKSSSTRDSPKSPASGN